MNLNREPHEPRPLTARTATANRTNRDRTACVKLLLGSTVFYNIIVFDTETNATGRAAELCQLHVRNR